MKAINCKDLFVEETFICQIKAVRDYFIQPLSGQESEAYSAACENIHFHFHYRPGVVQSVVSVHIFMQELKACIRKSFRECETILK